ncbi:hypothetical protein CEXT_109381 [Caerostris extrusa]|uniref:Uncharacterized protein n=1 Tax=Caerostris extrusa TaxID=172846 RepID=A0AAV4XD14_CAEEX|nr:hypothetical protein CEXT_109381 [Caerostris extrusa]
MCPKLLIKGPTILPAWNGKEKIKSSPVDASSASAILSELQRHHLTASSGCAYSWHRHRGFVLGVNPRPFLRLRFPGHRSAFDWQCLGSDIDCGGRTASYILSPFSDLQAPQEANAQALNRLFFYYYYCFHYFL